MLGERISANRELCVLCPQVVVHIPRVANSTLLPASSFTGTLRLAVNSTGSVKNVSAPGRRQADR